MKYTIAAIPTMYRGRQYRSRLEARWAAFFDQLGWAHEYEPFDLGSWSPDFLLPGLYGGSVLVEVKPITEFDEAVAQKMVTAAFNKGLGGNAVLLLLGVNPIRQDNHVQMGWLGHTHEDSAKADWTEAVLAWMLTPHKPGAFADIMFRDYEGEDNCWSGALSYTPAFNLIGDAKPYSDHAMTLWATASNAAQWKGPVK